MNHMIPYDPPLNTEMNQNTFVARGEAGMHSAKNMYGIGVGTL